MLRSLRLIRWGIFAELCAMLLLLSTFCLQIRVLAWSADLEQEFTAATALHDAAMEPREGGPDEPAPEQGEGQGVPGKLRKKIVDREKFDEARRRMEALETQAMRLLRFSLVILLGFALFPVVRLIAVWLLAIPIAETPRKWRILACVSAAVAVPTSWMTLSGQNAPPAPLGLSWIQWFSTALGLCAWGLMNCLVFTASAVGHPGFGGKIRRFVLVALGLSFVAGQIQGALVQRAPAAAAALVAAREWYWPVLVGGCYLLYVTQLWSLRRALSERIEDWKVAEPEKDDRDDHDRELDD